MSYLPGTIEHYEKLFVIISMKKGFVTPHNLIKALIIQVKEHAKNGKQPFIRNILLDYNIMSVEQIIEVCNVVFQDQLDLQKIE